MTADTALRLAEAVQVIMKINRSKGWVVHPVSQTADKNVIQKNPSAFTDEQKCGDAKARSHSDRLVLKHYVSKGLDPTLLFLLSSCE